MMLGKDYMLAIVIVNYEGRYCVSVCLVVSQCCACSYASPLRVHAHKCRRRREIRKEGGCSEGYHELCGEY